MTNQAYNKEPHLKRIKVNKHLNHKPHLGHNYTEETKKIRSIKYKWKI